ncbi:hypothetical protein B0H15DRAFT_788723 [Mycena belliarum]|uniref:Reverse transcriptase zinc-binding domain-containing protein n=1 Tax=Mycena belliarum TaxID=1033014 RepID=A0AAD6TTF4_9AGAR|nr:hypothetical protein B0H15DRAFT_788723 [Mycena belliae]
MSLRLPDNQPQTSACAEASSALVALQQAPLEQEIELTFAKKAVRDTLLSRLTLLEDSGWIGVEGRTPLRALAGELRKRSAPTFLKEKPKTNLEDRRAEDPSGAAQLAREGCRKLVPSEICYTANRHLELPGAKLASLTQATAYAGIRELKTAVTRKASDNNVKQVTLAIQCEYNYLPSAAQVWKSIRHKDFTRQVKNFLWKSLHSAHRIGSFWNHIPECEARGVCQFCDEPEDLEHILLKCRRPGQDLIWSLAKELWLKKHPVWPTLSLGSVLGCGLASFSDTNGRKLPGASRLYHILVSESVFMIWKVRNESVLARQGVPLPEIAIHNKWLHCINQRLLFDRLLTNHAKYGKQNSIKTSLVLQTWSATLMNEDDLPDDWIKEPRVLVGTEPRSSPPPTRPSGRRGRGR